MSRAHTRTPSHRQLRVGEEVRHALASILERGRLRDPGAVGVSVTVTEVRMSPDLREAHAFIVPLGGGDPAAVLAALGRARPFLRREVARAVRLRNVPDMTFAADPSFDAARRIDSLLRDPAVARDLARPDAEEEEEDGDHGA